MSSNNSIHWTYDPESIDLLDFLIDKTKDATSPLNISQLTREFEERSGRTICASRIQRFLPIIQEIDDIDTATKVKLLYALRVPINNCFLEYLQTRAEVVLDDHRRIIRYRQYGGKKLTLGRIHVIVHEESDAVKRDRRMMESFAQKSIEVDFPITASSFLKEFKEATKATVSIKALKTRFTAIKRKIHESTEYDQTTIVRMLFVSGASVPNNFLCTLRKDALVEVDKKNRITKYKANDGSLELQGDHSLSAKIKTGQIERSRRYSQQITNHFENKDTIDEEMSNLIRFITEKCETVQSPLIALQLAKEFSSLSGKSIEVACAYQRIRRYCKKVQKLDVLDTRTKVKQLFGLSFSLNFEFLQKLRKQAVVEVDHKNRIIKYVANDGSLTLEGRHWRSRKEETVVATNDGLMKENDEEGLDDDSDEYSSEESDSEFDSDNEKYSDETEKITEEPASGAEEKRDSSVRKEPIPEEPEKKVNGRTIQNESKKNAEKNAPVKTRYGRLSKRSHLDSEFSYELADFKGPKSSTSNYPLHSKSAKKKKGSSSSQLPPLDVSMVFDVLDDYQVKLEPFRGSLLDEELLSPLNSEDDIQVVPASELRKPKNEIEEEYPIKTEDDLIIPKKESREEEFEQAFGVREDDIKVIPAFELCDPKKEVEEEQDHMEMLEFPIKIEKNFIIPKLEELEEEDIKPELFY